MKKYLLSSLAIAGLMVVATTASAEPMHKPYVVGEVGYSFGTNDNGDAGLLGIGTGYSINEFLRTDVILSYRGWGDLNFKSSAGKHKADVWSIPVLFNMYATYPIHDKMGVYAMGGIGMAYNKTDSITGAKGKGRFNFAWNIGAGVDYMINDCWTLDLGYRYSDLGTGRVSARTGEGYDGKTKQDIRSHDVKLSARYHF